MNKLKMKLARLFLNKRLYKLKGGDMDNFIVTIRRFDAEVTTVSGDFNLKLKAGHRGHMMMLYLAKEKDVKTLCTFVSLMYLSVNAVSGDGETAGKIMHIVKEWVLNRMEKGGSTASAVSDTENDLALKDVKSNIERGSMTRQQWRKMERERNKKAKV